MDLIRLAENRWLPDALIRHGIRRLLIERLTRVRQEAGGQASNVVELARILREQETTIHAELANQQHYEVPARFFEKILGQRLKYSAGLWLAPNTTLDASEVAMLELTCQRAQIEDGMEILELGCGWGSLTLWMADRYPNSRILALSNSHSQRVYVQQKCAARGYPHVEVVTADVSAFQTERQFDRVISVEMFEHMRNYQRLLHQIANWLTPDGVLFVHIFCHRHYGYLFEDQGQNDWMARHFFSGGLMPSEQLLRHFDHHLSVSEQWWINGMHYAQTCEAWLRKLDSHRADAVDALKQGLNPASPRLQLQRWRMFFMACAELFAFAGGNEWGVAHYQLRPSSAYSTKQTACLIEKNS